MKDQETDSRLREIFKRNAPSFDRPDLSAALGAEVRAFAPKRRRRLRIAVYTSIAVILGSAVTVGSLLAVAHLGDRQPILVITDGPTGEAAPAPSTGGVATTATVGSVVEGNVWA